MLNIIKKWFYKKYIFYCPNICAFCKWRDKCWKDKPI